MKWINRSNLKEVNEAFIDALKVQYVKHWVCDRCGMIVEPADWESQEMLHWGMTGGCGSVWGDGAHVSIDLCQSCAKVLLGEFVKYREDEYED
jgi:hypothetical protein